MTASDVWRRNHPWASLYSFAIDRPWLSRPVARLAFGTDLSLFYDAFGALGTLAAGSAVLDVPCGSGIALRGVRPGQGLRYVAVDISPAMLARTRRAATALGLVDQVQTLEADVQSLDFAPGEFDVCVSLTGLHCFPDPRRAINQIARVLKPGGRLSLSWFRTDGGARFAGQLMAGRVAGLMGPSASTSNVRAWLAESDFVQVKLTRAVCPLGAALSGPLGRGRPPRTAGSVYRGRR